MYRTVIKTGAAELRPCTGGVWLEALRIPKTGWLSFRVCKCDQNKSQPITNVCWYYDLRRAYASALRVIIHGIYGHILCTNVIVGFSEYFFGCNPFVRRCSVSMFIRRQGV